MLALLLVAAAPRGAVGQSTLFSDDFESYSEGATSPGDGSWSITPPSGGASGFFEVRDVSGDKVFGGNNLDGDAVWETEQIDISNSSGVGFSLNLTEEGDLESSDYADVAYSTDGGSNFTTITDWKGNGDGSHTLVGNWTDATVTQSGLSGTSLVLRVTMKNNAGSEDIRLDDVEVVSGPIIQFAGSGATVAEGDGSTTVTVELTNASPGSDIDVEVPFNSGNSSADVGDIDNYSTQTVTFSSSTSPPATRDVTVNITDDEELEGTETAQFGLNITPGTANIFSPSQFDLEITDNDLSVPFSEPFDNTDLFSVTRGALGGGNSDYFKITDGNDIDVGYSGVSGSFLAGQDLDADGDGASKPQITWSGIDISGEGGLQFSGDFGANGSNDYESDDFLRVEYRIDGGAWQNLVSFVGDSNGDLSEDTDFDGTAEGTALTGTLSEFSKDIGGTGSTLDFRFTARTNAGGEDFAVDDFSISLSPVVQFTTSSGSVSESEGSTTLAVELLNPSGGTAVNADVAISSGGANVGNSGDFPKGIQFPSGAADGDIQTVDVNLASDGNAVFDLKNVSGGSAAEGSPNQFTLTIQDAVDDHSGDVMITEFMAAPSTSTEYLELYNTTGSDITMSSWSIQDEAGNSSSVSGTIPARGFFLLCGDTDPAQGGIQNCDDSFFAGLNNGGDGIELLDGEGTEIDTVGYSGSTDGAARIFTGTTDNQNADGSNWTTATRRERGYAQDQSGDDGSPGRNGTGQTLQPTTEISGGAGWRMLSAPVGGVTPKDLADVSLVQGVSGLPFSGAASNLYQWPGGPDDQNTDWTTPSSATTELTSSGQGFIWYVFDAAKTEFTDTPPFTLSVPGTPRTDPVTNSGLGEGFHLVGNPYAQAIDPASVDFGGQGFQTTVQIYDPSAGGYETITVPYTAENLIGPYQGFFVERTSSGNTDLVFNAEDRVADPISLKSIEGAPPRIEFQLVGRNGEGSVLTRDEALTLHAPEGATTEWDVHDASKLTPLSGLSGRYLTAAFRDSSGSDVRLQSVMSIPQSLPPGGLELPVSLQMQAADSVDTVRLSWPAFRNVPDAWGLALYDSAADSTVNLRTNSSYSFSLSTSKAQSAPAPRSPLALPTPLRAKAQSDSARFVLTVQPTPIPVELASFEATASGSAAQLTWATASETNNAGFHIERRGPESDGFASMGFVEGHGTTTQPQRYRYRTRSLGPGRHVFRLRQVDLDGSETRSDTVSVRLRLAEAATMAVAPNPVQTRATATLRVRTEQSVTVALYDVLGRRVRTVHEGPLAPNRAHTLRIDADALSSGLYLLRANGERFQETRRVTVVR